MIESKFHLAREQRKVALEATVIHLQPSFGKAPEVIDPVDMSLATAKRRFMRDANMVKSLPIEPVICSINLLGGHFNELFHGVKGTFAYVPVTLVRALEVVVLQPSVQVLL